MAIAGEWWGDPETSSLKYEPQIAFIKPATDIVLIGHAYAPRVGTAHVQVGLKVGAVQKIGIVFGDRRLLSRSRVSAPEPFERIPLIYERAFGGWDRRDPDPEKHRCEERNTVGRGFRDSSRMFDDEFLLPNIEDTKEPYRQYGDLPAPVGFGFISAQWQPRARFGGTYDKAWTKERMPLLPKNFDRRFFSAASPGLVASGYLNGNEQVVVLGAAPEGRLDFKLPAVGIPVCRLELRGQNYKDLAMKLDTVIINTDQRVLIMMWRTYSVVRDGPHGVLAATFQLGLETGEQRVPH